MAEIQLEDAPSGVRPYYDKGIAALERNNHDYAMDMFSTALSIEPRLLQVRKLLRCAAIKKSRNKPASKLDLLKASGTLMKISSLQKKDPIQALELAEQTLNIDPLNSIFAKAQCAAARAANLPEIAIQTLEFLKENNAAKLPALKMLAELYQQAEQFEQEFHCHENIVKLIPNDTSAIKEMKDAAARHTMDQSDWKK